MFPLLFYLCAHLFWISIGFFVCGGFFFYSQSRCSALSVGDLSEKPHFCCLEIQRQPSQQFLKHFMPETWLSFENTSKMMWLLCYAAVWWQQWVGFTSRRIFSSLHSSITITLGCVMPCAKLIEEKMHISIHQNAATEWRWWIYTVSSHFKMYAFADIFNLHRNVT